MAWYIAADKWHGTLLQINGMVQFQLNGIVQLQINGMVQLQINGMVQLQINGMVQLMIDNGITSQTTITSADLAGYDASSTRKRHLVIIRDFLNLRPYRSDPQGVWQLS